MAPCAALWVPLPRSRKVWAAELASLRQSLGFRDAGRSKRKTPAFRLRRWRQEDGAGTEGQGRVSQKARHRSPSDTLDY